MLYTTKTPGIGNIWLAFNTCWQSCPNAKHKITSNTLVTQGQVNDDVDKYVTKEYWLILPKRNMNMKHVPKWSENREDYTSTHKRESVSMEQKVNPQNRWKDLTKFNPNGFQNIFEEKQVESKQYEILLRLINNVLKEILYTIIY